MKLNDKLIVAKKFSAMMFEDLGKRYGDAPNDHPYSKHTQDVVDVLLSFGITDRDILAAAYLHDTLEDTPVTKAMLSEFFGDTVADYVDSVTDMPGANRKERKAATYPKTRANPVGIQIKLADRIANVQFSILTKNERMFRMYYKERIEFDKQLRTDDHPRMWESLDYLMYTGLPHIKGELNPHE